VRQPRGAARAGLGSRRFLSWAVGHERAALPVILLELRGHLGEEITRSWSCGGLSWLEGCHAESPRSAPDRDHADATS